MLAAKAVVLAVVTLAAGEVVAFTSFGLVQAVLAGHREGVSLGHRGVPGAVLSAGLLLCVCALLGLALGVVIRHTAGGIAATIAVIALPGIAALLPSPWNGRIGRFTLLEAAQQVSALHPAADLFSPGWSLLVLLAWPAAAWGWPRSSSPAGTPDALSFAVGPPLASTTPASAIAPPISSACRGPGSARPAISRSRPPGPGRG